MALTEQSAVDKIEVLESGVVQVRVANRVLRDGEIIATTYHRHCVTPGQDYSAEDARVKAICKSTHTAAVIAAYQAAQAASA